MLRVVGSRHVESSAAPLAAQQHFQAFTNTLYVSRAISRFSFFSVGPLFFVSMG